VLCFSMRRPSSSSCLLLPRGSYDESDITTESSSALSPNGTLSVTIISKEKLPSYSSERFFLLAEVEVHAQPTAFLSTGDNENGSSTTATQASDDTEDDEAAVAAATVGVSSPPPSLQNRNVNSLSVEPGDSSLDSPPLPPNILLYLLWKPSQTNDPLVFTESHILEAVVRLQEAVDLKHSDAYAMIGFGRRHNGDTETPTNTELRRSENGTENHTLDENNGSNPAEQASAEQVADSSDSRPKASLYIVVDRLMPVESDQDDYDEMEESESAKNDTNSTSQSQAQQEELAERLARTVASHPMLRTVTQGITVGVSNHVRAAPGLEACVQAITLGATDRRRLGNQKTSTGLVPLVATAPPLATLDAKKSLLGLVAVTPSDLLGLQDATVTDAAQGVAQSKVTAEWNGRGDLHSFAARGHSQWRCAHGLPEPSRSTTTIAKRKVPRRIRRDRLPALASRRRQQWLPFYRTSWKRTRGWDGEVRHLVTDVVAFGLILGFVSFHFGLEIVNLMTIAGTAWNDLIRSARGW
jgi:hypothetical protein